MTSIPAEEDLRTLPIRDSMKLSIIDDILAMKNQYTKKLLDKSDPHRSGPKNAFYQKLQEI